MGLVYLLTPTKLMDLTFLLNHLKKMFNKKPEFYNEMRDNLLIDPRLGLGPPTYIG